MRVRHCSSVAWARWLYRTPAVGLCALLIGCQSYERSDIDLQATRIEFEHRLEQTEAISDFAARLRETDQSQGEFDLWDDLSLGEGEVLALFYNPRLRLARLEAGVVLARRDHAGIWKDPVLGFNAADVLSASSALEYGITIGLTIPISGRLGVERDRADAAYEVELQRLVDMEWSTRQWVRQAWVSWSTAVERTRLLESQIERVEHTSGIADQLEEAGELVRSEARLLRIELAEQRASLRQAQLDEHTARLALLGLIGLSPSTSQVLVESLSPVGSAMYDDPIRRIIASNTELAIQRAAYQVAEETLRLEVRKQYPDIDLGLGYGNEDDDRLLLGFALPIPLLNANRGGIAEARANRELARARAEITFERLTHAFAETQSRIDSIKSQRAIYEQEVVPMLDTQSQELEKLINLGEMNTLFLLETVTRSYEGKSRLLDLQLAHQHAAIELNRLLGPDTPYLNDEDDQPRGDQ